LKIVAGQFDLHGGTVKEMDKAALAEDSPDPSASSPRLLGVDEFSIKKRHHYGTTEVDLETMEVPYVAEDRTKESLAGFYRALGAEKCQAVEDEAKERGLDAEGLRPLRREKSKPLLECFGACARRCPLDRIEVHDGKARVRDGAPRCMHCCTCLRVCPTQARRAGLESTRGFLLTLRKRFAEKPGNVLYKAPSQ
jgi:ferredoxin